MLLPKAFEAIRLNNWSSTSWAVVEVTSGAIAKDTLGKLLLRLSFSDADSLARAMTDALELNKPSE